MLNSFYADIVSTISHEWTGFPTGPNHLNIDEVPGVIEPRIAPFTRYIPYTIKYLNYNSDQRGTLDIYEVSFDPIPGSASNVKMQIGLRMRTRYEVGWYYAYVTLYNGTDHLYTLRKVLSPYEWEAVHSDIITDWSVDEINAISQIKLRADTNPIEVAALYLYLQYEV